MICACLAQPRSRFGLTCFPPFAALHAAAIDLFVIDAVMLRSLPYAHPSSGQIANVVKAMQ